MPKLTPSVPRTLLREVKRLVDREPSIEAIVLFGSRARGDAHPGSDYDLAVVSTAPDRDVHALCEPLARAGDAIQVVPVEPQALRTWRNTCNRVERAVVVDGEPLAGTWRRPRHRRDACDMDHNAFRRTIHQLRLAREGRDRRHRTRALAGESRDQPRCVQCVPSRRARRESDPHPVRAHTPEAPRGEPARRAATVPRGAEHETRTNAAAWPTTSTSSTGTASG